MGGRFFSAVLIGLLAAGLTMAGCGDSGSDTDGTAGPRAGCAQACEACGIDDYRICAGVCELEGPQSPTLPDCSVEPGPIDPVDPTELQQCLTACNACSAIAAGAPFTQTCTVACQDGSLRAEEVDCPVVLAIPCWNGFQSSASCWNPGEVFRQAADGGFDYWWTLPDEVAFESGIDRIELCTMLEVDGAEIEQTVAGCTAVDPGSYQNSSDEPPSLLSVQVGSYDAAFDGVWHEWLYVYRR